MTRWAIAADFCLSSPDQSNHCFAFTLIPVDDFAKLKAEVGAAVRSDIKNKRTVAEQSAEFLRDSRFFHVIIVVQKDRNLFDNGPGSTPLDVARENVKITVRELENRGRAPEVIVRARQLLQASRANSFNHKLYGDMILLSIFLPFISLMLLRERPADVIAWMPDRDNMTTWCDAFVWDLALESLHGFAERLNISLKKTEFPITIPDPTGEMWFDEFVRLADHFAGTVAAWDRHANLVPGNVRSDKFVRMLEDVIANADNSVILGLNLNYGELQGRRIVVRRRGKLWRLWKWI